MAAALYASTSTGIVLGVEGTVFGALAALIFPLIAVGTYGHMGTQKYVARSDFMSSGSKVLEGFVEGKGLEEIKGEKKLQSDMQDLFKHNIAELRQSLRELVTELKPEAAEKEKSGKEEAKQQETPEATFVKYLEQRETEVKQQDEGVERG